MSDRAYVHVWPPTSTEPVLAGQVIVMATGNGGYCRFKYADEYLQRADAFALDPLALPLEERVFESNPDFEVFSVLRDAGPDYWGRKVIEYRLDRHGLSELAFLLAAGDQRVGALGFSLERMPPEAGAAPAIAHLEDLLVASEKLARGEPVDRDLLALFGQGSGTMGGMRPKATVQDGRALCLAKFPARDDRVDWVSMEYLALQLGADAGLNVPDNRLESVGEKPVLITRRFDRRHAGEDVWYRWHYLSGLTMTGRHERDYGTGSYADLADWLRRFSSDPAEDCVELYRRMLFNIMIGNSDDHLRNHAVIRDDTGYRLSPAFDLVPQTGAGGQRYQAIAPGDGGRAATPDNALAAAARFGLTPSKARSCAQAVAEAVAGWREHATGLDLDRPTTRALEQAICPWADIAGFPTSQH